MRSVAKCRGRFLTAAMWLGAAMAFGTAQETLGHIDGSVARL